jgi:amicyanin
VSAFPVRRSMTFLFVAAWLLIGLGASQPVRAAGSHQVDIVDFAFSPAELTITVGDSVTWTNLDFVIHTATSTGGAFDSGDLDQGESYTLTFTEPGTYDYLCTPHPSMTGRIVVVPAAVVATPAPTPAPTAAATVAPGQALPDVAMTHPAPWSPAGPLGLGLMLLAMLVAVTRITRRAP